MKILNLMIICLLLTNLFYTSCVNRIPYPMDVGRFYTAIEKNDVDTVKYLIKRYKIMPNLLLNGQLLFGHDIHSSPIIQAIYNIKDDIEILDLLVKNGGNIHYVNENGLNAFSSAVLFDNVKALQYLIDKGVDVNQRDSNGETALYNATSLKYLELMQMLLENGADVNLKSNTNDYSVYHIIPWLEDISIDKRMEMFNLLLRYDPSLFDSQSTEGDTPFSFALAFGQYEMIDFFLKHGASVSKALNNGGLYGYLDSLLLSDNREYMIKLLNNCGGYINGKDENGNTLLIIGVLALNPSEIDYEILKTLAEKSENIDQRNDTGATAFMLAVAMNRLDMARLLLEMGANRYQTDIAGQDAIKCHEDFSKAFGFPFNPKIYSLF